jgi:hypothetical protein
VFLASWYYAEGIDTDVKYGCLQMLDGLVSSHPMFAMSKADDLDKEVNCTEPSLQ